jgi:23S rRNA pseudouridine2605 synthase
MSGTYPDKMRLNRFLARAGVASRRDSERYILAGRVSINGKVCRELATKVAPGIDNITVDGREIVLASLLYFKVYKPRGMVSTLDDPQHRESLGKLLQKMGIPDGVVSAGRLDKASEGLLILTNDGDLLQQLMHPSHDIEKVYRVLADRRPSEDDLLKLREGVQIDEYIATPVRVSRMGPQPADDENPEPGYWLEIVMQEGRKREIREMLSAIGYSVQRLVRIAHGPIKVGTLKPGEICEMSGDEIELLQKM